MSKAKPQNPVVKLREELRDTRRDLKALRQDHERLQRHYVRFTADVNSFIDRLADAMEARAEEVRRGK